MYLEYINYQWQFLFFSSYFSLEPFFPPSKKSDMQRRQAHGEEEEQDQFKTNIKCPHLASFKLKLE